MAQVLKDEVRERIERAALEVFARRGYRSATMADIAREAGVSTGNIYRYHGRKQDLFDAVVPVRFARKLSSLMRRRVDSLRGVKDVSRLGPDSRYGVISEELLRYCIDNRLRVVILLGRAVGTRHEGFAGDMIDDLKRRAIGHFRALDPDLRVTAEMRYDLDLIYAHFVRTMVGILERYEEADSIRKAVESYTRYHLSGLRAFFG